MNCCRDCLVFKTDTFGDLVDNLRDEALGKWALDPNTSTLTLFRLDGSVSKVFTLKAAINDVVLPVGDVT